MKFNHQSRAYERQQNTQRIAPVAEQPQQAGPLASTRQAQSRMQPPPQPPPQPQRMSQGEQPGDQQDNRQDDRQGEPDRVGQGVRSHSQYQELQQPLYRSNAPRATQPWQQTKQAMQLQQGQPQARPPATAYREVTPFPQQPTNRVPDRPPSLPHNPYKTLPPRWSRNDRLNASTITQFLKI
ncbi:hypothetical protein BDW02DRAFT_605783 [Decorospora gaudefroyi]|uniref:Uncharacterized protein n=1 Tax=Decorospora gaudefroyi TaxID=184978 RepID=A0A6A5K3Q4_9PLEO|nr:hypothetical protein BDW02DRAFT_605783 [Decorospora gaudefroyi]